MNTRPLIASASSAQTKRRIHNQFVWPLAAILLGAAAGTNLFFQPDITLSAGLFAWAADMALALICCAYPFFTRIGILVTGLFLGIPCFLDAPPICRGLLMCSMMLPLIVAVAPLMTPPTAGFRGRLAFLCSWGGTRKVMRRTRSFDWTSLIVFGIAMVVLAVAVVEVKANSGSGICLLTRWLFGGIMILAFAEMVTANHNFLTALLGLTSPSLMQSPILSKSLSEFWNKRWNPGASLLFHTLCFAPLARRGVGLAMFFAFSVSALAHVLLAYMAIVRWRISLVCGAFFLVQPVLIEVERRLKVRRWRPMAGRVWTLAALAITSPMFVEPGLQIVERSWGAPDSVLPAVACAVGFVVIMNSLFAVAALASHPKLRATDASLEAKIAAS